MKDVDAKFRRTVENLLAMPPEKQTEVARVRRRNKSARKAEIADAEALAAIARAYANIGPDGMDDDDTVMRYLDAASRIADALESLVELRRQLPPRTVNT